MATKRNIQIYKFVEIDGNSQTAAANEFGISQPTISGIISKIKKELQEKGKITIEKETSYPHSQGGFWCSDEQNDYIQAMTAQHGSYSEAMRQIIENSMKYTGE